MSSSMASKKDWKTWKDNCGLVEHMRVEKGTEINLMIKAP